MRIRWLGAGPAICLIHAFPADARQWAAAAQLLASSHRIGLVDLPGFGGQPEGGDSLAAWSTALRAALAQDGVERTGVAGCSMGGYVGIELLRTAPDIVECLALVGSRASADDDAAKAKRDETIARLEREGASFLADLVTGAPGYFTATALATRPDLVALARDMAGDISARGAIAAQVAMRDRPDGMALLRDCGKPLAVVHGDEDGVVPLAAARDLAAALPSCGFTSVRGAAHFAPLEQPVAVAAALSELFRACRS